MKSQIVTLDKPAIRTVVIPMIVPSHKNQLRPSRNGGFYLDQKAKKERDAMIIYLKALTPIGEEWACRLEMDVDLTEHTTSVTLFPLELYDHKKCPDTDGILCATFDAMQKAGIIANDNRIRQIAMVVK